MGNDKVSKDFLSKVNAIKADKFGKDKKNIDSKFEYAAISVWSIRYSKNLNKAEKEYLQNLKAEYEDKYIGSDLIGDTFKRTDESLTPENLTESCKYLLIFDKFNEKLHLYEEETTTEDKNEEDNVTIDKEEEQQLPPEY